MTTTTTTFTTIRETLDELIAQERVRNIITAVIDGPGHDLRPVDRQTRANTFARMTDTANRLEDLFTARWS